MEPRPYLQKAAAIVLTLRLHRAQSAAACREDRQFGLTVKFDGAMLDMLSTVLDGDSVTIFIFSIVNTNSGKDHGGKEENRPIIVEEWNLRLCDDESANGTLRSLFLLATALKRLPEDCRFSLQTAPENAIPLEEAFQTQDDDLMEPFGTVQLGDTIIVRYRLQAPHTEQIQVPLVKPTPPPCAGSFESIHNQPPSAMVDEAAELTLFLRKLESRPMIVPGLSGAVADDGDDKGYKWEEAVRRWLELQSCDVLDI